MSARLISTGGYTPSEQHLEIIASRYTNTMAGRAVIYCHGAGSIAPLTGADARTDLEQLADRGYVVSAGTLGSLTNWGNAACSGATVAVDGTLTTGAVTNLLAYLNTTYGAAVTRPLFIADSMGAPGLLNWAVRNPTLFGAGVLRVPALNIHNMHNSNIGSFAAGIETAYTNLATLEASYSTRDPGHPTFQDLVVSTGIRERLRIYYNPVDPIVAQADVLSFARNCRIEAVAMQGPSHAPWGYFDIDEQRRWLELWK